MPRALIFAPDELPQAACEFTVPVGGQLLCYFNDVQIDWFYENNSGWVLLDVERIA